MPSRPTFSNLIAPILCAAPLISNAAGALPTDRANGGSRAGRATAADARELEEPKADAPARETTKIGAREIELALQRGIALLVAQQEDYDPDVERGAAPKTGGTEGKDAAKPREWPYEGVYRVGGEIPIGYRIGGTSIAASALITAQDGKLSEDSAASVRRGLEFVLEGLEHPLMTKEFEQGYDVRGWGHAYGLAFLLLLREQKLVPKELAQDVDLAITKLVTMLQETEIETGGWNYSRPSGSHAATAKRPKNAKKDAPARLSSPSTFMTAPTLQILFEAARQGERVDAGVIERALKTLEDARLDTGAFQYGTNKAAQNGKGFEDVPGAVGRMTVCETTLFLAGRGSVERVRTAIDAFFTHWEWLEKRRKQPKTHEPPYMIAPYYFFYAHRYVAQGIEFLPEAERAGYREKLYALLWKVREEDGGWNDRVFPRSESFGTAMTLLALHEPTAKRPAAWSGSARKEGR